jgi:hypothetical protein
LPPFLLSWLLRQNPLYPSMNEAEIVWRDESDRAFSLRGHHYPMLDRQMVSIHVCARFTYGSPQPEMGPRAVRMIIAS